MSVKPTTGSGSQQELLERPVVRFAYFVSLDFLVGSPPAITTVYLSTLGHTITWNGHDWSGVGQILSIGGVEEAGGATSSSVTLVLNIAQGALLSTAVGEVEEYRGMSMKMYFCPVDENFVLLGTPIPFWRGIMDTVVIGIDGEVGQISIKCENSSYSLKRKSILRINAAQQKLRFPNDTGLMYLNDLFANPQRWLSKKFQSIPI